MVHEWKIEIFDSKKVFEWNEVEQALPELEKQGWTIVQIFWFAGALLAVCKKEIKEP